ncbi:uncharacterized protein PHACADRAFT_256518 [Phanerochaete carnosa HHB-10118-sp]|uniref:Heterokaryon incompatibility domain-containing protein n=1 Tax=Phanerochaete carnosa (strain HHB-10118-sp) TaxID=650164 RepID=K5W924_PHACS|nr:uncharacterized protein PHACADRAFT_256518 [Phanerochaete carnosa HHB-10118-sp]EKM55705.1 hypothetical protein PHACADRAFT_256518 [Phanerochaete carnosa HHB-10118-sp]
MTSICSLSLRTLEQSGVLDISECGTPCRYRLIDCADYVRADKLTIYEYTSFPTDTYATVSYVWRGNAPDQDFAGPVFSVTGAEDGDPIGFEVLREACIASMARGATHVWLDRLCIMQTSKADKRWQIREMYTIYRSCHVCVVAPGGIQRLVRLDEETQWIHRGWTLQEAVAPPIVVVLFSWRLGGCRVRAGDNPGVVEEVTPSKSAMAPLSLIVDACTTGSLSIEDRTTLLMEVKLFSSHPSDQSFRDFPFWRPTRRVMSPNVGALARAMSKDFDQDIKDHSIWQSALMRTSSRSVDMVFSIMGLFGVTLDTSQFHENDRAEATIALARAILAQGRRVTWLAAAFRVLPSQRISTFPIFPRTSVSGKAYMRIQGGLQEVSLLMENEYPIAEALVPMPCATMDQEGYLTLTTKAVRVQLSTADAGASSNVAKPMHVKAVDDSLWEIQEDDDIMEGEAFAVLVGFFVGYYPGGTPAHDANNIRAMVVQKHAPDKFHVCSYLMFSRSAMRWVKTWSERTFSIGGPATEAVEDEGEELPIISATRDQYLNNPQSQLYDASPLEGQVIRRARWAVPQKVLEREHAEK